MTRIYRAQDRHIDFGLGRVVAPGETVELAEDDPGLPRLLESGALVPEPAPTEPAPPAAPTEPEPPLAPTEPAPPAAPAEPAPAKKSAPPKGASS